MARLILDTAVLVAAYRGQFDVNALADTDDLTIPAVAVGEYLAGVELVADPARRASEQAFLDDLTAVMPVIDHDRAVAASHARLLAHCRRSGQPRGALDLLIAASAVATERTLLTSDAKARFDELPGVTARLI